MLMPQLRRGRRAGFTIIELLISMTLMSLVAGAIVKLLLRQERFYNSTTDLIQTRQQIRQAAAMLPADLRGISSVGGDIYTMSDSALEPVSTTTGKRMHPTGHTAAGLGRRSHAHAGDANSRGRLPGARQARELVAAGLVVRKPVVAGAAGRKQHDFTRR